MPSITFWTRLEPFTRLDDISPGLQAQVADPLWMLARQWQTGEFQAEDSGSPVQARLRLERAPLARYFAGPTGGQSSLAGRPYQSELPLEALVEREPVQSPADPRRDRRLAAEAGLYFLRLLESLAVPAAVRALFATTADYLLAPAAGDPAAGLDAHGDAYLSVMAGRVPDGFLLYTALKQSLQPAQGSLNLPPRPVIPPALRSKVLQAGQSYLSWFEGRYSTPAPGDQTWNSERLEYSFAVSASSMGGSGETALEAPEYPGGSVDWYTFDLNSSLRLGVQPADPRPEVVTRLLIPTALHFAGMASDRWWEFEDGQVNFSRVEGDPDELMRLLLVHFALVYSNDWYLLPVELSPGALYRPISLVVTDAFGESTLVPHYSALDAPRRDWRVFSLTATGSSFSTSARAAGDVLFLPPTLAAGLHGDPIEEVMILRDEMANLVWAVERLVPSLDGGTLNRYELYHQRKTERPAPSAEPAPGGELRYLLATTTPDHWIPFLPVRIDPNLPDIRLRRAAALLDEGGGQPGFTRPLGRILEPERADFSLFEEEAPRSGIRLVRQFQFTRWVDGSSVLWLARRKGPGQGESTAGLFHDQVS